MFNDYETLQQEITWLTQQVNCIKNGECCGVVFLPPAFTFDNNTGLLTSTYVDGTPIAVDLSTLAGNIYTNDGVFGAGRQGTLTDTLSILSSTAVVLNTFYNSGNVALSLNSGKLGVGLTNPTAKLSVRGIGNTTATTLAKMTDNSGQSKFSILDEGQLSIAAGVGIASVNNLTTGVYVNTNLNLGLKVIASSSALVADLSNPDINGRKGLDVSVGISGSPGSLSYDSYLYYGISANVSENASYVLATNKTGIYTHVTGASGVLTGAHFSVNNSGTVTSMVTTDFTSAIRGEHGATNTGVGDQQSFTNHFGGYFTTMTNQSSNNVAQTRLQAAVYGHGVIHRLQPGRNVGGMFSVLNYSEAILTDAASSKIALLVPQTNNSGNVVFGADDKSVNNSMLEVTGHTEVIGVGNGVIQQSPDGTRWKITIDNAGVVTSILA